MGCSSEPEAKEPQRIGREPPIECRKEPPVQEDPKQLEEEPNPGGQDPALDHYNDGNIAKNKRGEEVVYAEENKAILQSKEIVKDVRKLAAVQEDPTMFYKCPKGHTLTHDYAHLYPLGFFRCQICGNDKKPEPKPWTCEECEYHICDGCRNSKDLQVSEKKCTRGHRLVFSVFTAEDLEASKQVVEYDCPQCRKSWNLSNGRWYCPLCRYNLCCNCEHK